ncbi:MAG: efflux RND transporter periplasmic adaptor subunit [Desulfomonile tiedjei]|nr:efflux RND transporter periplasmic adaptor subunit [Desulfomonile tiedjei]
MTEPVLPQERFLALAVELCSRAVAAESVDEVYFILTNDLRILVEFDRCFLIMHLGGESRFVSATHQPVLDGKSRLQDVLEDLSRHLLLSDRPLVLSMTQETGSFADQGVPEEDVPAFQSYAELAGWKYLCCLPLTYNGSVVGHLLMEFLGDNAPEKDGLMALVKASPVFGAALAIRWLFESRPVAAKLLHEGLQQGIRRRRLVNRYLPVLTVGAILVLVLMFLVPMKLWVGGEAIVAPEERQYAFCKIGGLIDRVYVRHGSQVEKDQELAVLDHRELDLKIRREDRQLEMLAKEMALLRSRALDDPSMLGKTRLLELKRESVQADLDFLRLQRQFLVITAPVAGVIISKDVETFSGKKLEAGEPFCEIAELGRLCAEIHVPEDRIMGVRKGQKAYLYLNSAPRQGYLLTVQEIAPKSEVEPRLGNVYKVRAAFVDTPEPIKVGMKGIGSIDLGTANLWTILSNRLAERWNQAWLRF